MMYRQVNQKKRENTFERNDVFLSNENLYRDYMRQQGYSDPEFSCNHVNPTVEDENTVWKVRGCQGESGQYIKPLCQALVMKETVFYGPEMKVRPLPPLPKAKASGDTYEYVDQWLGSDAQMNLFERNHFEEKLQVFKEMIISNVDVRQVLPHLTFVEYPQKYRNIATNTSCRNAMICLVDDIKESEELGRWEQFVQSLERCGYEYISRCLEGRSVIDHRYQKEFLKIMSVTVRKHIVPTELTAYLWNVDALNDEDKQRIECQQTLQGEIAAADLLLEILPTKNEMWYTHFIDALRHAKMTDVANMLDLPELRGVKTGPKVIATKSDNESDMKYENKDSSNADTLDNEFNTWSSWDSMKSVLDIPFFVLANRSRQKERQMELSISEGDCLKVIKDYGDFFGVQGDDKLAWLIPKDSVKVFDKLPIPLPDKYDQYSDFNVVPPLPERAPVNALKINATTDAAKDCNDGRYEKLQSPDLQDNVDEKVCTQGSLNELLDLPPLVNAFKKTEDSRENNVRNAKCTRQLSSSHLLKDSLTLDDVIDADWKTVKEEQDRLLEAERLVKEELEQLKAVLNLKNNINELQCQKLKVAMDFASAGKRFKLHSESIKGVQGGNFDHFEPESEYSSEGLYSAQHMLRMKNTSRDLPLNFEIHRARSTSRKSWRSGASSFKDSAIYDCTNLATVEEDT